MHFRLLSFLLRPCPLSIDIIRDERLHSELRVSIRIRRTKRTFFRNRNHVWESGRISIYRRRRGEDNVGHIVLLHTPQQAKSAVDVDMVVVQWNLSRLSYGFQSSEVDDIVNVWVLVKDCIESFLVGDVEFLVFWSLAGDEFDAVEDFVGRVVEIVDDDHFVVGFEEGECCEGPDVACATTIHIISVSTQPLKIDSCFELVDMWLKCELRLTQ